MRAVRKEELKNVPIETIHLLVALTHPPKGRRLDGMPTVDGWMDECVCRVRNSLCPVYSINSHPNLF